MENITLKVQANCHIPENIEVNARVDESDLKYFHSVTLHFDNGDYCDVNVVDGHTISRRISNYRTLCAVEAFKQMIQDGKVDYKNRIES